MKKRQRRPFSFARPKENGQKVPLYGMPHYDILLNGKKDGEIARNVVSQG
jgi:hypothetical protein